MKVLILGADGFIGRHLAFGLRAAGAEVIAAARAPGRLAAMGFRVLAADLGDPATQDRAFWAPHLAGGVHVVNCAGLLTGSEAAFRAVHLSAPAAVAAARDGGQFLQVSSVGIEGVETPFARHRRAAEAMLAQLPDVTVLRPGLVLAETSYGGSSLMRAFAALPFARPVVGAGDQPFNPIHAADLAAVVLECLRAPPGLGPFEIGGPESLSQEALGALYRRWLGLRPVPVLPLPVGLARALGRLGDALRLGPISATAVAQLQHGVQADPAALLARIPTR
ncbi:MAG: NAD(P)H-binding protein, partial [Sphingomonadales bacterium]|nr:NAD(P)H-binding protein [Sphingomonadales bacterium]